jgi:hypothetical protein
MTNIGIIYLVQPAELVGTLHYKVGCSNDLDLKRIINGYKKGTRKIIIMEHKTPFEIEKKIISKFKEKFNLIAGNEYFEGDEKDMKKTFFNIITTEEEEENAEKDEDKKDEEDEDEENEEEEEDEEEDEEDEEKNNIYTITTYEEWIKYNNIDKIIITNRKKCEGYIRFKGELWRKLYNKNAFDYYDNYMENLHEFIKKNYSNLVVKMTFPENILISINEKLEKIYKFKNNITNEIISYTKYNENSDVNRYKYKCIENKLYKFCNNIEYDDEQILQDIVKKCYNKSYEFYDLKYNEYIIRLVNNEKKNVIYNALDTTFTPIDTLIHSKILLSKYYGNRILYGSNTTNITIVNNILTSLIDENTKLQYKKLLYNLIVKHEENIIFYDYNETLLTTWITDLLYSISNNKILNSHDYYNNKKQFIKNINKNYPRCVIISNYNSFNSIEQQIEDFKKLGFKNIIVSQKDKLKKMYNILNFRKYLESNKEIFITCIKNENNYAIEDWEMELQYDDSIFYNQHLFVINLLKWCCVK